MVCAVPRKGFLLQGGGVSWSERGDVRSTFYAPCRSCWMCRADYSRDLLTRFLHEATMHRQSVSATLTYSPECLPEHGSLRRRDLQLFIKRLRKRIASDARAAGQPVPVIRYHAWGEYSPQLQRPHVHVLIFGWWPGDAEPFGKSRAGNREFGSALLSKLWPHGLVSFQSFCGGSGKYVAEHQARKLLGDRKEEAARVRDAGGRIVGRREPEFALYSKGRKGHGGIGAAWLRKHARQVLADGYVVADRRRCPIPLYYRECLDSWFPDEWAETFARIVVEGLDRDPGELSPERLAVRNECAGARVKARAMRESVDV